MVAIGGRFGDLIADIPFTVIVVLIASLAECFLVLPHHMAQSISVRSRIAWYDMPSYFMNYLLDQFKFYVFRPFIRFVIWARYPVFAAVVVTLASQAVLFINGGRCNGGFSIAPERGSVTGNFAMAPGATREDSLEQMRAFQKAVGDRLGRNMKRNMAAIQWIFSMAEIGGNTGRGLAGADTKDADQLALLPLS